MQATQPRPLRCVCASRASSARHRRGDEIARLAELRDQGGHSDVEFQQAKAKALG